MLAFLARLLLVFALTEFALVRVVLRTGPILPEQAFVTGLLSWVWRIGMWSLNVAVLAGGALLVALVVEREQTQSRLLNATAALAGVVILSKFLAPLVAPATDTAVAMFALSALHLSIPVLAFLALRHSYSAYPPLLLLVFAYGAASYHFAGRAALLALVLPGGNAAFALAEALVLLLPVTLLYAGRLRWHVPAAGLATGLSMLYGGMALAKPKIASAIVMWDIGLSSYLPAVVYVAAVWLLVYTVVLLLSREATQLAGVGLALLALGGLRFDYAYFSLLSLSGLLLVVMSLCSTWMRPEGGVRGRVLASPQGRAPVQSTAPTS